MNTPLVSVIMITYGHEKYIKQAIEGVFSQKTKFIIELIISNDCSPDLTDTIVKDTIKNAPDNIVVRYTCHSQNMGMIKNSLWTLSQAKGKYLAICDGDDYWINENKLQTQVDFLEQNPDFSICTHNFMELEGNTISEKSFFDNVNVKEISDITDLAKKNIVPTLSAVCKNIPLKYEPWMKSAPLTDLILFLNIAKEGKIKYFNQKWAVYRKNVGIWHKNKINYKAIIYLYKNLANDFKNHNNVYKYLKNNEHLYIKAYMKTLKITEILNSPYFKRLTWINRLKILIIKLIK